MIEEYERIKYFRILGIDPSEHCSAEKLKKTYHKLAKEHHPDNGGDPDTFRNIHYAYKMLSDPSFSFKEKSQESPPNLNFMLNLSVTFEQAFFGDYLTITTNPIHINENREPININKEKDVFLDIDVIRVPVSAGTSHGENFVIPRKGLRYKDSVGDLVITYNVCKHPRFQLRGADVVSVEHIPLDIMIKGGEVEVSTMYGIKTLEVPPGTSPNTELKIKNMGVQSIGSHIFIIRPIFPTKEELKKNKNWKKFGIKWKKKNDGPVEDEKPCRLIF